VIAILERYQISVNNMLQICFLIDDLLLFYATCFGNTAMQNKNFEVHFEIHLNVRFAAITADHRTFETNVGGYNIFGLYKILEITHDHIFIII
jgi:hypothetical protein